MRAEPGPNGAAESADPVEVGIDSVELERVRRALDRFGDRFLRRVYTDTERIAYAGRVPELAVRFAAKEAAMKALGSGRNGVGWREIEVLSNSAGKPFLTLHGRARARADALGLRHFAISLTHSRTDAVAVVVASR